MSKVFIASICIVFLQTPVKIFASTYPGVGDVAIYDGLLGQNENQLSFVQERSLINLQGDQFTSKTVTTYPGQTPLVTTNQVAVTEITSKEKVLNYLKNCQHYGGTLESIAISAGKFLTCRVNISSTNESREVWIADVPFGMAKAIIQETNKKSTMTLILRSFVNGNL